MMCAMRKALKIGCGVLSLLAGLVILAIAVLFGYLGGVLSEPPAGGGSEAKIGFVEIKWMLRADPHRTARKGGLKLSHAAYLVASLLTTE